MQIELLLDIHYLKRLYMKTSKPVCQKYNLTQMEMDILGFLYNNPNFDMAKDIVERRMLTKSHVSASIENLYKKGLINKVPDVKDKRIIHLHIEEKCRPICEDIASMQENYFSILSAGMSEEECSYFSSLLHQAMYNAKTKMKSCL